MKSIKYVTHTWLFALVLFPVMYIGWFALLYNGNYIDLLFFALVFGFLFSLPVLALCMIFIEPVLWLRVRNSIRFVIWILLTLLCVYGGTAAVFILFFDYDFYQEILFLVKPAYLAAFFSTIIRHRQFRNLTATGDQQLSPTEI